MHSATFDIVARAILTRQQLTFVYEGHRRETCPHILGHRAAREAMLAYQFGGTSSRGLPPKGEWRCFYVDRMQDVRAREGRWHTGGSHQKTQACVDTFYLDVNTQVPNQPGRR
jgi:predicted DNA-binding transcriptional regulator YafY